MSKSTEIATPSFKGAITLAQREGDQGKGSINVNAGDLLTPHVKLLQLISSECKKHDASYVSGAEAGMFMHTTNHKLFTSVYVMNLHYVRHYNVWDNDDMLVGVFDSEEAAQNEIVTKGLDPAKHNIVETPTHLLLLLDETGRATGTALLYMSRSKVKASKAWNTMINELESDGRARFSHIWQLSSIVEVNKKGQEYYNVAAKVIAEAPDDLYAVAKTKFEEFFGQTVDGEAVETAPEAQAEAA